MFTVSLDLHEEQQSICSQGEQDAGNTVYYSLMPWYGMNLAKFRPNLPQTPTLSL